MHERGTFVASIEIIGPGKDMWLAVSGGRSIFCVGSSMAGVDDTLTSLGRWHIWGRPKYLEKSSVQAVGISGRCYDIWVAFSGGN